MNFLENRFYTIIFTFIYAFVFILILSGVNLLTKERIRSNEELIEKKAILLALGIPFENDEEVFSLYQSRIQELKEGELYSVTNPEGVVYALKFNGKGLWGTITGIIAVNADLSRFIGLSIISHSETPGLGGRIEEDWFTKQFQNEKINNLEVVFAKNTGTQGNYLPEDGIVDAITGASRTSELLNSIINKYLQILKSSIGE
ncbi:MAG: FMN-binding protein [Spirochaetes bacterium]|nr:FMN-binding protein [Spirochaetota bacterium]